MSLTGPIAEPDFQTKPADNGYRVRVDAEVRRMTETCEMVIIETASFEIEWECSACKTIHKDKRGFDKKKNCPECGATITNWVGMDEE